MTGPALYTIPAGAGFADVFAAVLLQQNQHNPEKLAESLILLPTRRACRIVRDAFLRQSGGTALLLPRMQTLGDVDEDVLGLEIAAMAGTDTGTAALDLPPAMTPLHRQTLLMRLIMQRPGYTDAPERALALAGALGLLMDRVHTEGLALADLPGLVAGEFAAHWQITVDFLSILDRVWPALLAAHGRMDAAARRARLLRLLAQHWRDHPPAFPVIAAGSTGSIPATADVLQVVAGLPQGAVVLPGLDRGMDSRDWDALDDTHPQATLKHLLGQMGVTRDAVRPWPGTEGHENAPRQKLAREIMRPAATTDRWRDLARGADAVGGGLAGALDGVQHFDCATGQEEARLIALMLRHAQHQPGMTAALVTFDRDLARRVAAECGRWGLALDDSAGTALPRTPVGGFLALCAQSAAEHLAPVPLLALLKHGHCAAQTDPAAHRALVRRLDRALRGPRPGPGIDGLRDHAAAQDDAVLPLVDRLEGALGPLLGLCDGQAHPFAALLDAHLGAAEALAAKDGDTESGAERLWAGEDGESAALFLSALRDHAGDMPPLRGDQYWPVLETLMQGVAVRPAYGTHPRLMILGPLEARLVHADLVILGGLNEGSWPPSPAVDPWMSRPMAQRFGLPGPDRGIGLSAHDFVQGFCARTVVLTRAERAGTAPTVPARWLRRLEVVLAAAGLEIPQTDWLDKARTLDRPDIGTGPAPRLSRPAPTPDVRHRPVRLSVTEIETWMRDPYAIYAKHILNVRPLDPVDQTPDAADRGTILHDTLDEFVKAYPDTLPDGAYATLSAMGRTRLEQQVADPKTRHFWGVRFDQAAAWFIRHEQDWRAEAKPVATEIRGTMTIPGTGFTLTGKADRIDSLRDGSGLVLVDYKTGGHASEKQVAAGLAPQLPLEAAMAREGAFAGVPADAPAYLEYWKLSGGSGAGGKATRLKKIPADTLADQALLGLEKLVRAFANENTPYLSLPRPAFRPAHQDYAHLARVREWAVLDDDNDGGGA